MSFNRGPLLGSSTPQQPQSRPLYPSFNLQTPATPTPSNPTQPLQQKPPQRPASVPLGFGGGLSHSTSTPSLSTTFQTQDQQQPFPRQTFSPAPQPPLTTFDLSSPFQKQPPVWGAPLGGHGLQRSHSQQFMPQPMGSLPGERRYLRSHLRSYSPERSSPLAKESVVRDQNPSPKEKRRVSFGSVTTFGNPSTSNFGGAGFGTPKDDPKSKSRKEDDDLPPSASIYDTSRPSSFQKQDQEPFSPPPDTTPSLFSSMPSSSPKKITPTPVILFGFPPSHSLLIIREYERYGPILEHFSSTSLSASQQAQAPEILQGSNWLRITYADPVSAARAVATNGQVIGGAYMIGVMYAPKPEQQEEEEPPSRQESSARPSAGEKKMNVIRGGQSMFMKKEGKEQVGWGTWLYNQVVGKEKKQESMPGQVGSVGGGGEANVVVRALKGLSETVFGF